MRVLLDDGEAIGFDRAHLFLIGFRNRLIAMLERAWEYFTFARRARVVAQPPAPSDT